MPSPQRLLLLAAIIVVLCFTFFFGIYSGSWTQASLEFFQRFGRGEHHFHLVLPATASNLNLCRLLLSGLVTGYPEPVLVGWDGHGLYDGAKSHLFKISETLAYLNSLPASADHDLVMVLDAYDIWLQLRPDVLIERYFEIVNKANQQLKDDGIFGLEHGGSDVRQSILFGPDKTCWPSYSGRAACWAIPESPMSEIAFGPATDKWMVPNRPRWLNSGTIIGPVNDMRDMFNGTMQQVRRAFDENFNEHNSDQYYFQDVFAAQEVGRTVLRNGSITAPIIGKDDSGHDVYATLPDLTDGRRTEYHITLDYETQIFQTSAAYTEYLTWMSFNHSTPALSQSTSQRRMDQIVLPNDIENSPPPFAAIEKETGLPVHHGWADMMLGMNGVTQTIFPIFHMTGVKGYRDRWWPRMWFHSHGKDLLDAARSASPYAEDPQLVAKVNGVKWKSATVYGTPKNASAGGSETRRGGAWSDQGAYMSWDDLCSAHEQKLYQD